jgi:mono/diheme cytochrome c family protein
VIAHGNQVFAENCAICHGQGGAARATFPDLRRSTLVTDQAAFDAVVLQGARAARGMGSFANRLNASDTEALRAYLIGQAEAARNAPAPPGAPRAAPAPQPAREIHENTGR